MSITFADIDVFEVAPNGVALAVGDANTALAAQGHALATDAAAAFGFTSGSPTVTTAGADVADIGRYLFNDESYTFYVITGATAGVSYTIGSNYVGTTDTHSTIIFTGPVSGNFPHRNGEFWGGNF